MGAEMDRVAQTTVWGFDNLSYFVAECRCWGYIIGILVSACSIGLSGPSS